MTQVNLPNRNITGDNLWSQVEDNDDAIADAVNGNLDDGNIKAGADINGSKLLDGSITAAKLGTDSVTATKLKADATTDANRPVTTNHIRNGAVTNEKVTLTTTSANATMPSGTSSQVVATKFADKLVILSGSTLWTPALTTYTVSVTHAGSNWLVNLAATLPEGYRPSTNQVTTGKAYFSSSLFIDVLVLVMTTGQIYVRPANTSSHPGFYFFDGITFIAA